MIESLSRSTSEILRDLHSQLEVGFRDLRTSREQLTPAAPVFALEHGLSDADLELLKRVVRSAVQHGFGPSTRQWWLPFVVYAAESGHEYAGREYWQTFEGSTPGWHKNRDRDRIRNWFQRFANDYGGAQPQGAFAEHFGIIAWPITHAVLPVYLQRHLARLLYEFRTGLTSQLLQDPHCLGKRLAARSGPYPEQFRYFCQNAVLLGHVSVALLSGEDDGSPYLLRSTLRRLVTDLSRERESQEWLSTARRTAGHVRSKTRGLVSAQPGPVRKTWPERLPRPTDPRLLLRRGRDGWQAFVELPDLSPLTARLPEMADELRSRRAGVAGAERRYLARGQLNYSGYQVRLARWPRAREPFIRLEHAPDPVNRLIADQCAISSGPTWLFRLKAAGLAVEVKGKTMHPGASYILVVAEDTAVPPLPSASEVTIEAAGVRALRVTVPDEVSDRYAEAFAAAGVSLTARVVIKPVGIVASSWDGEGAVEWLAGESGMICISSEETPETCVVTLDGRSQTLPWPDRQGDLLLRLDDLSVGTTEVAVALTDGDGKTIADGYLAVIVRDPQVRLDTATPGEGIRLLADPAQPTLSDLWDGRAELSIDGPPTGPATLTVILYSEIGEKISELEQQISLPVTPKQWRQIVAGIRADQRFKENYDEAQSTLIAVSHSGIGFASLTCERGFQPLQWRVTRRHDGRYTARLIDRTGGAQTVVEMFPVDEPLVPVPYPSAGDIDVPAQGGLLRAVAGGAAAVTLLPTDPTEIVGLGDAAPVISEGKRTSGEILRLAAAHLAWATAHRPADPFAIRQCDMVLDAIVRAIASLIGKRYWARVERRIRDATDLIDYVGDMQASVGDISRHQELADRIAHNLWRWSTPQALLTGFSEALAGTVQPGNGTRSQDIARFALTLADQPGQIFTGWNRAEREELLTRILRSPVLLRSARFALLGTRAFNYNFNEPVTLGAEW